MAVSAEAVPRVGSSCVVPVCQHGRLGDACVTTPSAHPVLGSGHVARELPRKNWASTLFTEVYWVLQACRNVTSCGQKSFKPLEAKLPPVFPSFGPEIEIKKK